VTATPRALKKAIEKQTPIESPIRTGLLPKSLKATKVFSRTPLLQRFSTSQGMF